MDSNYPTPIYLLAREIFWCCVTQARAELAKLKARVSTKYCLGQQIVCCWQMQMQCDTKHCKCSECDTQISLHDSKLLFIFIFVSSKNSGEITVYFFRICICLCWIKVKIVSKMFLYYFHFSIHNVFFYILLAHFNGIGEEGISRI